MAAFYKYGDRTEVVAKSLEGTKDALESLRAYIVYDLGRNLLPLVQTLIESRVSAEQVAAALSGEQFNDVISDFVSSDVGELAMYGQLLHARRRWSVWAHKLSWAILGLTIWQSLCAVWLFISINILSRDVGNYKLLITYACSVLIIARCFFCIGVMLYYHDQICKYRENIL